MKLAERLCRISLTTGLALAACAGVSAVEAATQIPATAIQIDQSHQTGEIIVPVDKSRIINVDHAFSDLSVGNAAIADVVPLTNHQIYVLGKKVGRTNLTISTSKGHVYAVVDLSVSYDVDGLKSSLYDLMPDEKVEVHVAGESLVLSGQASTPDNLRRILLAADNFAPGKVTNMMTLGGSQQVMLQVRFAEVQRATLKELGISANRATVLPGTAPGLNPVPGLPVNPGDTATGTLGSLLGKVGGSQSYIFGAGDGVPLDSFATAAISILSGRYSIDAIVDALEQKGFVHTLAEPNLIALSGDTANFLAGGEFPIPVAQALNNGASTVTVEFKEFGVGLAFTPTVIGKELVNLEVKTEVSSIDPSVSVKTNLIEIPGLRVRRAKTTVELKDGQSFAIAGLLQDDFRDTIRQVPGLGNLPVIGALMRSSSYQRQQTELVVFITAHLVQPTSEHNLALPTDRQQPPSPLDFFLMGNEQASFLTEKSGGIDGSHGYILP